MRTSRLTVDDRLVLGAMTPAGGKKLLLGPWLDRIHNGPALSDSYQEPARSRIPATMETIGSLSEKSGHYRNPDCKHLFIDFPPGPLELGEDNRIIPDDNLVEGKTIRLRSPTDCVKDRLAATIHWKRRACFDQALLVYRRFETEGGSLAFTGLIEQLAETDR